MKLKISLMSVFMLILLTLQVNSNSASNPVPLFYVHVQPVVCDGSNVANATVTITDHTGTPQSATTDPNGWAYFTAAVGTVHVKVTLSWDNCKGYEHDRTQPYGGDIDVECCLVAWC